MKENNKKDNKKIIKEKSEKENLKIFSNNIKKTMEIFEREKRRSEGEER